LLMAKLCADARFCILTEPDLAAAFTRLNSLVCQSGIADQFVTFFAAVLDPAENILTLVNAGHPPPLICHHAAGTVSEAISNDLVGLPLGVLDGFTYVSAQLTLAPGDNILAFTDGVTDAMDLHDLQLETEGVLAAVQSDVCSPCDLVNQVVQAIKQFSTGRSQHDDIALVGFGRSVS